MLTEKKVEALMAEVILDVVKDPANDSSAKVFCAENCLDRHRLTSKAIFSMQNATLFRIMMGIAQLASLKDYLTMCIRMALITYFVAKMEDGSPEAIRKAHAGSPIGRQTNKITCSGHDYSSLSLEHIVVDERSISELCLAFGQTLDMISKGMDCQEWDSFRASLGQYIFQDED